MPHLSQRSFPSLPNPTSLIGQVEMARKLLKITFLLAGGPRDPMCSDIPPRQAKQMKGKCVTSPEPTPGESYSCKVS